MTGKIFLLKNPCNIFQQTVVKIAGCDIFLQVKPQNFKYKGKRLWMSSSAKPLLMRKN